MKIAVIGTGISGMVTAWLLNREHAITVFESGNYIGGHTNTVRIEMAGRPFDVDTGFIVFNERTYPNFCRLLQRLNVASQETEMSFSVTCERSGLEYCGSNLDSVFVQRKNLLNPSFLWMLCEILKFNRNSPRLLMKNTDELSLESYLDQGHYSQYFRNKYLIPMAAAIWSTSPSQMLKFPARYLIQFLSNHGLLTLNDRPIWRTISGGSRKYVECLVSSYRDRIRLNCPVQTVRRTQNQVEVVANNEVELFDQVIFATHADQALRILHQPTQLEKRGTE